MSLIKLFAPNLNENCPFLGIDNATLTKKRKEKKKNTIIQSNISLIRIQSGSIIYWFKSYDPKKGKCSITKKKKKLSFRRIFIRILLGLLKLLLKSTNLL